MRFNLGIAAAPEELRAGLCEVVKAFPERFGEGGRELRLEPLAAAGPGRPRGFRAELGPSSATLRYGRPVDAFRGLSALMSGGVGKGSLEEKPRFESLGVMIDASRNGVCTLDTMRDLILRAALMGIDSCMLYCEDTYEVPGEPFFGYLRGRYGAAELKSLDDYAAALGVELFPCIQTLGHLGQILQWPAYKALRDDETIALAGAPETLELLEKAMAAATAPFRSRRINLGMDEASGIGQGRYKALYGEKAPFDIMCGHLKAVRDIAARLGLKPVIWSDMFFRLGSATHSYYDPEWRLPQGVAATIPADVELVYWDYYHEDEAFYRKWIAKHREMGVEPAVALGAWTWNRFWAELDFARRTIAPGMAACGKEGIREVVLTNWGDDGMEVDIRSALPAWQLFAEYGWASGPAAPESDAASLEVIEALAATRFRATTGGDYRAWVSASALDRLPGVESRPINPSKVLLYEDPLLGMWEPQYPMEGLPAHYAELASRLEKAAARGGTDGRLAFPALIARVLSVKTALRPKLVAAYRSGDKAGLCRIAASDLPELAVFVDRLWRAHRELWLETYKPFGLEVLELRYGFLRTRLESLALRLDDYLGGKLSSIPELETELLPIYPLPEGKAPAVEEFRRIASPSRIV
jgi:hypothetical protein